MGIGCSCSWLLSPVYLLATPNLCRCWTHPTWPGEDSQEEELQFSFPLGEGEQKPQQKLQRKFEVLSFLAAPWVTHQAILPVSSNAQLCQPCVYVCQPTAHRTLQIITISDEEWAAELSLKGDKASMGHQGIPLTETPNWEITWLRLPDQL